MFSATELVAQLQQQTQDRDAALQAKDALIEQLRAQLSIAQTDIAGPTAKRVCIKESQDLFANDQILRRIFEAVGNKDYIWVALICRRWRGEHASAMHWVR